MTSLSIFYCFVTIYILQGVWSLVLDYLNFRSARRMLGGLPSSFQEYWNESRLQEAVEYSQIKSMLSMTVTLIQLLLVVVLISYGTYGHLARWVEGYFQSEFILGPLYFLLLALVFWLAELPFALYSTFVIEEKFGFNKQTFRSWCADQLKSGILVVLLSTIVITALLAFMGVVGAYWWIVATIFILGFQLTLVFLYPSFIAPFFNTFEPLAEGDLRDQVEQLCQDASFEMAGVFQMDGSKRSAHANAYFTGFGKAKRIVLFDTLIDALAVPEVVAVLAHEVGHQKCRHILKQFLLSAIITLLFFWALNALLHYTPLYFALGFGQPALYKSLVLFPLVFSPLSFFLTPLTAALSRRFEFEADGFAAELTGSVEELQSALQKLSSKSLSNLTPDKLYSRWYYSHPTLLERVTALQSQQVACEGP